MTRILLYGFMLFVGFILGILFTVKSNGDSNLVRFISYMKWLIE